MKAIVQRLIADLRWRLSKAGRKYKPKATELESWAPLRVPVIVPLLIWGAYMTFALLGVGPHGIESLAAPGWEWLLHVLLGWPGWVLSFILLSKGTTALNQSLVLKAYAKLLNHNERFTLVEYTKYLHRQIQRAGEDVSLGGPAEVTRLRELRNKLHELLRQGAGDDRLPVESALSEEVDLAEAVVQAYELPSVDLVADLDERLPGELRQRIEELDLEVEQSRENRAQPET